MAEFYHIYDYTEFEPLYIAVLVVGLRPISRLKTKLSGVRVDVNTLLLAHIADNTALNFWAKTQDAKKNKNKPDKFVKLLCDTPSEKPKGFKSGEAFLAEWRRING